MQGASRKSNRGGSFCVGIDFFLKIYYFSPGKQRDPWNTLQDRVLVAQAACAQIFFTIKSSLASIGDFANMVFQGVPFRRHGSALFACAPSTAKDRRKKLAWRLFRWVIWTPFRERVLWANIWMVFKRNIWTTIQIFAWNTLFRQGVQMTLWNALQASFLLLSFEALFEPAKRCTLKDHIGKFTNRGQKNTWACRYSNLAWSAPFRRQRSAHFACAPSTAKDRIKTLSWRAFRRVIWTPFGEGVFQADFWMVFKSNIWTTFYRRVFQYQIRYWNTLQ